MGTARSPESEASDRMSAVRSYVPLGEAIASFWLDPAHRQTPTWSEHLEINEVMLATRLARLSGACAGVSGVGIRPAVGCCGSYKKDCPGPTWP